jgi:hypothetical protein
MVHAWRKATSEAALFDDDGTAAHWSTVTRRGVERGLGLYLGFLAAGGRLRADDSPANANARACSLPTTSIAGSAV